VAFDNGASEDATGQVSWKSSATDVATVSSGGLLTAKGFGDATVTAVFERLSTSGSVHVTRSADGPQQPPFQVTGLVHEPTTDGGAAVANARIEVVGGPLAGQVFATDEGGQFALPPVTTADFYLYFKKNGYDDSRFWVKELPRDQVIDMVMLPLGLLELRWSGTLEEVTSDSGSSNILKGWPGDIVFETYRSGEITLALEVGCRASGTYTDFFFYVRAIPSNGSRVAYVEAPAFPGPPYRVSDSAFLPAGRYALSGYAMGYSGSPCPWSLTVTRPY
jgi:hypothetical protein